ncbi:MAG TPA: hypothetical protein VD948_02895 [Rhodothermales bacterium]|nr:hypothetical protein [Rhodothermales bacterium]
MATSSLSSRKRLSKADRELALFASAVQAELVSLLTDADLPVVLDSRNLEQPYIRRLIAEFRALECSPRDTAERIVQDVQTRYAYRISGDIIVDHPERRDASYRPVPAGSISPLPHYTFSVRSYAETALRRIMAGEGDFSSEYVGRLRLERQDWRTGLWTTLTEKRRDGRTAQWKAV